MTQEEIDDLVGLRNFLIEKFERVKDYRQNKNAIMREVDHAENRHSENKEHYAKPEVMWYDLSGWSLALPHLLVHLYWTLNRSA